MQRTMTAVLFLAFPAIAEIIDRVAVTVDTDVVTESEIRSEIRVTAFLNAGEPDFSAANRRATAERLVDQLIMRREMRLTRYEMPTIESIQENLRAIKSRFPSDTQYQAALKRYGITEEQLKDSLLRQAAVIEFIDLRFKPEVQVLEPELMEFYGRVCLPEYRKTHPGPDPVLEDLRTECEEKMIAERVDQRVEAWLKEARGRARIHYQEDAFS